MLKKLGCTQNVQTINGVSTGDLFIQSCKEGDFKEAVRLHSLGADIYYKNHEAFRQCCKNGHFIIAKWLHCLGTDIHTENDYALRSSYIHKHYEIAKWLQKLGARFQILSEINVPINSS